MSESVKKVRLLLVEDDFAHARIIQRALGDLVDIFHVSDGDLALDYVYGRGAYADRSAYPLPELILLDLRMPRVDGFEVLKTLKGDELTRLIPIVILSTSDRPQDVNSCYLFGANAYVAKPLDFNEFSRKVAQIFAFWSLTAETPAT